MNQDCRDLYAFMKAIEKNPRDVKTRLVFADWLDDHDEAELAAEHRAWDLKRYDAEIYLRDFARRYAGGDYEGMLAGLVEGEYYFGDDDGPYEARGDSQLWEAVRLVTGADLPEDHVENSSFRCAC